MTDYSAAAAKLTGKTPSPFENLMKLSEQPQKAELGIDGIRKLLSDSPLEAYMRRRKDPVVKLLKANS